jgi:hypothetical protein
VGFSTMTIYNFLTGKVQGYHWRPIYVLYACMYIEYIHALVGSGDALAMYLV